MVMYIHNQSINKYAGKKRTRKGRTDTHPSMSVRSRRSVIDHMLSLFPCLLATREFEA